MKPSFEELSEAVHAALRAWHSGDPEPLPWSHMLLIRQHLSAQAVPNLGFAIKEVLMHGLDTLETREGDNAARILRLRFLDGLTAQATANSLNLTENVVYKQQRTALGALAEIITQAEDAARLSKLARIEERLEIKEPPRLFGVEDKRAELVAALEADGPPWLVALVGIGGIGKTSLADQAVRDLATTPRFADVVWVSARRDRFTLWDGLAAGSDGTPALTFEGFMDRIVEQLGFADLARLPLAQKLAGLRARLKARPYLAVIDNLDTAADYHRLLSDLQALVNPTRILLTSRHRLHEHPGVRSLSVDELSEGDSLALLRYEASTRGLSDVAGATDDTLLPVFEVAGGNPLALKLLLGQMHTLSLSTVVENLRQARGQSVEALYRFIYWRSWNLLGHQARQVLAVMPLVDETGGGLEQITAVSGLDGESVTQALQHLVNLSLVDVRGTVDARRYGVHQLTETFLLTEVFKW